MVYFEVGVRNPLHNTSIVS